ncbi:MAG TPA: DEAD/DEAH box helicase [Thermoanaerobaculia bacterium]
MPFVSLGLDRRLVDAVSALGFEKPTPIQSRAIPPALAGRDLLACAATGSGKSAAFLLPILHRFQGGPRGRVRALVLTPTRELAAQIDEHRKDLARFAGTTGAAVYGGVGMGPQETALRRGVDVLVATPGRLLDHLQHPYARLDQVEVVVLDEADRMLDMGFLPDVRRILARLPAERQTLFFSATMPAEIAKLAREILKRPETISIERRPAPAAGITQAMWPVAQELKTSLLLELLNRGELENALVFTRTKHRANRVADWLVKRGIVAARIHGNRSQAQRTEALAGFKAGKYRVLVATDVAARGIDIEALPHVVNFDVPAEPDAYIHRVGRTARAEREGDAWTFVSREEQGDWRAIERAVGRAIPERTLAGFDYAKRGDEKLEIPIQERIAAIRTRKAEERQRAKEKAARKAGGTPAPASAPRGARPAPRPAGRPPGRPGARPARPAAAAGRGGTRPAHDARASHRRPTAPSVPWWQRLDA